MHKLQYDNNYNRKRKEKKTKKSQMPTSFYSIIFEINSGNQFSTFVTCPRLSGKNWKVFASPCMFSSSSAWICRWPKAASSSKVFRVDEDPVPDAPFVMPGAGLVVSSTATRKTADAEESTDGFEEDVKMSWIFSWRPSYLEKQCQHLPDTNNVI